MALVKRLKDAEASGDKEKVAALSQMIAAAALVGLLAYQPMRPDWLLR